MAGQETRALILAPGFSPSLLVILSPCKVQPWVPQTQGALLTPGSTPDFRARVLPALSPVSLPGSPSSDLQLRLLPLFRDPVP